MSPNIELEAKSLVCRGRYDIGSVYSSGHIRFAFIHNLVGYLPEFLEIQFIYSFIFSNLGLGRLYIATL